MAKIIEISGVPASGKSTFLMNEGLEAFNPTKRKGTQGQKNKFIFIKIGYEMWLFILGSFSLSFNNLFFFFKSSLNESGSIFHKINIFRNIIKKFGVRKIAEKENIECYIDEGISHIPFNLLNSDTQRVIESISPFLSTISLYYIEPPSLNCLKERLEKRGHPRLKYWETEEFIKRNLLVSETIKATYPQYNIPIKVVSPNA